MKQRNLATASLSEISDGAKLRREEDGGEESAVKSLDAFAGALFVGISETA
jgi:hypothetical protein